MEISLIICNKCKLMKRQEDFSLRSISERIYHKICKKCNQDLYFQKREERAAHNKEYYLKNKELIKRRNEDYRKRNRGLVNERTRNYVAKHKEQRRKTSKKYYDKNREVICKKSMEWVKKNYKINIPFRLRTIIRNRLNRIINGINSNSGLKYLGCSAEELKIHLEKQFQPGMSWENYGEWEIDHIYPLSKADLTREEELKKVCNYANLQPLWKSENRKKFNKI